jgi:hypothetical protein
MGDDRKGGTVKQLTSSELHDAVHQALEEVSRRLESGELDGSGRYYTDEELAAGTATGMKAATRAPRQRIP